MFISIPKEFFVEVMFDKRFVLNNENNNMEFDTENAKESYRGYYRESNSDIIEEINDSTIYTELKDINIEANECKKADSEILDSIDDEYIGEIVEVNNTCQ